MLFRIVSCKQKYLIDQDDLAGAVAEANRHLECMQPAFGVDIYAAADDDDEGQYSMLVWQSDADQEDLDCLPMDLRA